MEAKILAAFWLLEAMTAAEVVRAVRPASREEHDAVLRILGGWIGSRQMRRARNRGLFGVRYSLGRRLRRKLAHLDRAVA